MSESKPGAMKYSLRKVVVTDWPALAASLGIPIIWVIHLAFSFLQKSALPISLWLPASISLGLIAWLVWRISRVARLFAQGQLAIGQVTGLVLAKDRGRLEFSFDYQGKRVSTWMPIHQTKAVLLLTPGTVVEVLFDKHQPARAIVKQLFWSE